MGGVNLSDNAVATYQTNTKANNSGSHTLQTILEYYLMVEAWKVYWIGDPENNDKSLLEFV